VVTCKTSEDVATPRADMTFVRPSVEYPLHRAWCAASHT